MGYKEYKEIEPKELQGNIFESIGSRWFLVTASKEDGGGDFNTMTASWGGMGVMWAKPVVWCVIRPVRYTYEFIEGTEYFTFSFFPEKYKKTLNILGTKSGRDIDKKRESGLTPSLFSLNEENKNAVFFEEADTVLVCKKLYYHDINPDNFIDKSLDKNYPEKDYHRMYFGEIVNCLTK